MDKDLRILEDIKTQIEKGFINFKKSPKDRIDEHYVETRQAILERLFTNFSSKYESMVGDYGSGKIANYFQGDVFEATSESYLSYQVELKKAMSTFKDIKSKSSGEGSPGNSKYSAAKLPKIQIPIFSGKYTEWSSFRDLFISLIHNNSILDDVQRLHYLKTQLSGEAEQLIRHVPVTQANYKICWNMIESRYNNKKYISNCILQRLFSQKNINVESSSALKELLDVTSDCLNQLSNLGINIKTWDVIVVYLISLKLDVESRKQWELHVNQSSDDLPSWLQFKEFLETRFRALEFIQSTGKPKVMCNCTTSHPKEVDNIAKMSCPHCAGDHKLFNCKKFCKEEVAQRRTIAQSLGLCFNCLGKNHTTKVCRSLTKCRFCQRKHHTLLHLKNFRITSTDAGSSEPTPQQTTNISTHFLKGIAPGQVLLATALIRVESEDGSFQILRALIDQGSQASFVTEEAAQLLRLKKFASKTKIAGIGGNQSGFNVVSNYSVSMNVHSQYEPSYAIKVSAHVLSSLTSVMPGASFEMQDWPDIHNVQLADPQFNSPNKIDVLLGADIYCQILKNGLIRSPKGSLVAQATQLGWIVSGYVGEDDITHSQHNLIVSMHAQVYESIILKQLQELDSEPSLAKKLLTSEEQACDEYHNARTKSDEDRRFIIKFPLRCDEPPWHLKKTTEELPRNQNNAVYLPLHAFVTEAKLTTKIGVNCDASYKVSIERYHNDNTHPPGRLAAYS